MTNCISFVLMPRNSPIVSLSSTVLWKFKVCYPGPEERSFYYSHRNAFHVLSWNSAVHRTSNLYHSLYPVDGWIRDNTTLTPFKTMSIYLTKIKSLYFLFLLSLQQLLCRCGFPHLLTLLCIALTFLFRYFCFKNILYNVNDLINICFICFSVL